MRFLRDWIPLMLIGVLSFLTGKSHERWTTIERPVTLHHSDTLYLPSDTVIDWKERIVDHWKEVKPETVVQYEAAIPSPFRGRILSLDWDRGWLHFIADPKAEYTYRLPPETVTFSVRSQADHRFFVKHKSQWWDRRFWIGATYPGGAYLHFDITFNRRLLLESRATGDGMVLGVGWRIF